MKYQRLKSTDGTGSIIRYYKLTDDVAYCNAFYKIVDGEATKISGSGEGAALIGFSHGGNNLAKGLIFLDIGETPVYMGIFEEGEDTRPEIGDLVNGYQRVIDTHYDGDEDVDGKNDEGWGVEVLDNPYYLFVIEQPEATNTESVDDSGAGEVSGVNFPASGNRPGPEQLYTIYIRNLGDADVSIEATPVEGDAETYTVAPGAIQNLALKVAKGKTVSTVYPTITGTYEGEEPKEISTSGTAGGAIKEIPVDVTNSHTEEGEIVVTIANVGTVDGTLSYTVTGSEAATLTIVAKGAFDLPEVITSGGTIGDVYSALSFTPEGGEAETFDMATALTANTTLYVGAE